MGWLGLGVGEEKRKEEKKREKTKGSRSSGGERERVVGTVEDLEGPRM